MATFEKALVGGGCFWCIEAVYNRVNGVYAAISGYTGGARPNPTYEQVCTGVSGHAEVVEITYDPAIITYSEILDIFWALHDPTTLNAQGADKGTQYRSVIYYYDEAQKEMAVASMQSAQTHWSNPIVTELSSVPVFYPAEDYHQNYYNEHPTQGYCHVVITPKIQKFMAKFGDKVKR